jgi:hypothetical protein
LQHRLFAAALAAGLALASVAAAQPQGGDVAQLCKADIQKLCPDAKMGPGGGMRECVTSHFAQLSQPCQDAIKKMRAAHQDASKPQ